MGEAEVQARILLACGALPGVRLFRNHVAQGWSGSEIRVRLGELVRIEPGMVLLGHARRASFGLCPGSGDLIGWRTRAVGGQRIAQFTSLEVKTATGRATPEQENWLSRCREAGACADLVRSPAEALAALGMDMENHP